MTKTEILLIKNGELALKGLNRSTFEDALMRNLRRRLNKIGKFDLRLAQSTIYIEPTAPTADLTAAAEAVSKVFGIAAFSRARVAEKDIDAIGDAAVDYLADTLRFVSTFKVETKRADKTFPLSSPEISREIGGRILSAFPHLRVDVHTPDVTVFVEIRDFGAYVHADQLPGAGGMPVGTGGRCGILISGGIDSPVAAYMMAKRGVELFGIHFASPPYTSERAEQKVVDLLEQVAQFAGRMTLCVVPFTHIQEQIREKCPEEYFTLIMRRFMMRLANELALELRCRALVTGENLGQVASQTMQALAVSEDVTTMPVLRPLIGMDKEEIVKIARHIGTFDTSILPYEDCCTVFTPRHPKTKPSVEETREYEAALDVEGLCRRAMENREMIRVKPEV